MSIFCTTTLYHKLAALIPVWLKHIIILMYKVTYTRVKIKDWRQVGGEFSYWSEIQEQAILLSVKPVYHRWLRRRKKACKFITRLVTKVSTDWIERHFIYKSVQNCHKEIPAPPLNPKYLPYYLCHFCAMMPEDVWLSYYT